MGNTTSQRLQPVLNQNSSGAKPLSETFICPITRELMVNPVIDREGNSYEQHAIEDWLRRNRTSPITRSPLLASDLRPNRALKTLISEYRQSLKQTHRERNDPMTEAMSRALTTSAFYADGFLQISIHAPPESNRTPCSICCVVDTSGSMATEAEIQTDDKEKFGLSQLDLVKHALKTVIHSLQPHDRLALVSFANNANVVFHLTAMTEDGKSSALAALERLTDSGQTNLWDGLRLGLEVLSKENQTAGRNSALFLLTDGCPNVEPPRGHLEALKNLKESTRFPFSIHNFGFGYELDSKLLEDIAILGNSGSYAFIPDGSFVGTIFINAITTLLATARTNVRVCVHGPPLEESDYTRWHSKALTDTGTVFDVGSVIYGQSKDLLIPIPEEALPNYSFSVTYDTCQGQTVSISCEINMAPQQSDRQVLARNQFRLRFVHSVRTALEALRPLRNNPTETDERTAAAINQLNALQNDMQTYADGKDEFVKDLLADLTGQVQEALTNREWFKKWGIHYLPSLTRSHLLQYCNNFKDLGVQNYGRGQLFSKTRDEMDRIFCSLPAARRSNHTSAPVNMSYFHNADGGCFYGECWVRLFDGTVKLVKNVVPGDRVAPHGATVKYVVKTKCRNHKAKLVVLESQLIITAWHPVRINQQWIMPCSLVSAPTEMSCEEVYNFALDRHHTVLVNNVECVTLGHDFKDDIVRHPYFGSQRVIDDLSRLDAAQNNSGIIEITADELLRSSSSGLVSGLRHTNEQHHRQISVH